MQHAQWTKIPQKSLNFQTFLSQGSQVGHADLNVLSCQNETFFGDFCLLCKNKQPRQFIRQMSTQRFFGTQRHQKENFVAIYHGARFFASL